MNLMKWILFLTIFLLNEMAKRNPSFTLSLHVNTKENVKILTRKMV